MAGRVRKDPPESQTDRDGEASSEKGNSPSSAEPQRRRTGGAHYISWNPPDGRIAWYW